MIAVPFDYLDSPATALEVTYSVELTATSGVSYVNRTSDDTNSSSFVRSTSTMICTEIAA
jgi:hypothetical protein